MIIEEINKYFGKHCRLESVEGDVLEGTVVLIDNEGWVMLDFGFSVKAEEIAKIEEIKPIYH